MTNLTPDEARRIAMDHHILLDGVVMYRGADGDLWELDYGMLKQHEADRHELADALEALLNIADSSIDYNACERARALLARIGHVDDATTAGGESRWLRTRKRVGST